MAEEELHEIQLNGKQLVFLFMAGTVAAVVIFLCGLMVGRNIRSPRLEAAAATSEPAVGDPTRPVDAVPPPPVSAPTEGTPPVSAGLDLNYGKILDDPKPVDEGLRESTSPATAPAKAPAQKPSAPEKVQAAKSPAKDKAEPASLPKEPSGNGWAVQVQAVNTRDEADAVARRLAAKGYHNAFVTARGAGLYAVRVGKYENKREAEAIKARLEKEEQFKPWVTR